MSYPFSVTSVPNEGDPPVPLSVDIQQQHTLSDVRGFLTADYGTDDNVLPPGPWSFYSGQTLIGRGQETKKRAWDMLNAAKEKDGSSSIVTVKLSPTKRAKVEDSAPPVEIHPDNYDAFEAIHSPVHQVITEALQDTSVALQEARSLLRNKKNKHFFGIIEKYDLSSQIDNILKTIESSNGPRTMIAVLGRTGEGKSSLLNALLGEALILPTSGCRGCTATAVELAFNNDLMPHDNRERCEPSEPAGPNVKFPVYKAQIEFISIDDWREELAKSLVDNCCDKDGNFFSSPPKQKRDALASWQKLTAVYGKATIESLEGVQKETVLQQLSEDPRILGRLSTSEKIEEGMISTDAMPGLFVPPTSLEPSPLIRLRRKWAECLRSKLNRFVFSTGDDDEPQVWPLIRKVKIQGPWSVLSSGACLVDLPGLQDANRVRAKVSDNYIQECDHIFIVAKIQRAVDDGNAHKIFGKQLKHQLVLDGTYQNVSFVCTMTDDIETSESERELKPFVQEQQPQLWQQIEALSVHCDTLEGQLLASSEKKSTNFGEDQRKNRAGFMQAQLTEDRCLSDNSTHEYDRISSELHKKQKELKALWASTRNEYSRDFLKKIFQEALRGLDSSERSTGHQQMLQQALANVEVFAVSANDYLKLAQIKPSNDGGPSTFDDATHTEVPQLQDFVHLLTSEARGKWARLNIVGPAFNALERLDDIAKNIKRNSSLEGFNELKVKFKCEIKRFDSKKEETMNKFDSKVRSDITSTLDSAIGSAANKACGKAPRIVSSWARFKRPNDSVKGQLRFQSYHATLKRGGEFSSPTRGYTNFNKQLVNPMQDGYYKDWDKVLGHDYPRRLREAARASSQQAASVITAMQKQYPGHKAFHQGDWYKKVERLSNSLVESFNLDSEQLLSRKRRELNRSPVDIIKIKMQNCYQVAMTVRSGPGRFRRMRSSLKKNAMSAAKTAFSETKNHLVQDILKVAEELSQKLENCFDEIRDMLEQEFSVQLEKPDKETCAKVPTELSPKLSQLRQKQLNICDKLVEGTADGKASSLPVESTENNTDCVGSHSSSVNDDASCLSGKSSEDDDGRSLGNEEESSTGGDGGDDDDANKEVSAGGRDSDGDKDDDNSHDEGSSGDGEDDSGDDNDDDEDYSTGDSESDGDEGDDTSHDEGPGGDEENDAA